ncbi:MAG: tetratricopeptide repeat protein [Cytophagia bacterium]|nr:tetratricopeptide repeat protein [Cytophagia bacterium]
MKTQTAKKFFLFALVAVFTLSGCALSQMKKMAKDQQLSVDPTPLEVHADSVKFDMTANLPLKMLKPNKVYQINTFYTFGTQERQLKTIQFRAVDYPNSGTEQPSVTESFSFPYTDAMSRGSLQVQGKALNPKNGNFLETDRLGIADGVITTSTLVQPSYYASYAPHGYNDQEELIPTNVEFFFDQGRSVFKTSEKNSDRGTKFAAFIAEKNVTRTVTITGTHSPEGKETINSDLSKDRAAAIEKWYREEMDKYDYQGMADQIRFIQKPIVQDWNGLKTMLASYNGISSSEKSEWTRIINGTGSFEQKEKQLQGLSTYKKVFTDIYPQLRTAKTEVLTVKVKKSREEISTLANQIANGSASADALSLEEMLYAAANNPSLTEKQKIYEAAAKKNDTYVVHNNLGAVHLQLAMQTSGREMTNHVSTALNHFNISNQKQSNVFAQANLGMALAMQGNLWGSHDALTKAAGMNPGNEVSQGVNGAKGAVEIKVGRYDLAIASLNRATNRSVDQFNKGLVQLLRKDFRNAQSTLESVISSDRSYVMAHYVAAVAAARQDNENKVIEHLRNAINADSSLKAKAATDLEFRQYTGSQAFMDLIN